VVHLGAAAHRIAEHARHLEVLGALLGERVQQLAEDARAVAKLANARLALERACVEGDGLVPGVRGRVVAVDAIRLAVVDRIFELADHVHPQVHVRGALLRRLAPRRVVVHC